ncbi:MAG: peptide-methionine (S)-S-oxide reductase MsrA [Spirochaetaceae bacterium]|nr:peptide-methionine (S)-S-oxide reductase MsrA [Spirochaetaceae bacterium]
MQHDTKMFEKALLAGGCFWCLEAPFSRIDGVKAVRSGYCGGTVPHPSYETVCTGLTGHAETVEITFDPARISYRQILDLFWKFHDPTTLNRQGADVGEQYRSVIFYLDERQREIAEASLWDAQAYYADPIVTALEPAGVFWPAEEYHQSYYARNPDAPYCRFVIAPKLAKAARG